MTEGIEARFEAQIFIDQLKYAVNNRDNGSTLCRRSSQQLKIYALLYV